jgi:hypothetical protein
MLSVISLVLGIHFICFAESDHIGIVKTVAGDTVIVRNDKSIRAEVNTKVLKGDLLKTGPDGKVGVIFEDDTVISMGPNSEIVIENFLFRPAEKKMSFIARIIQGTASFISGQITKLAPDLVHIETPDATIGMRGTQVLVQVE